MGIGKLNIVIARALTTATKPNPALLGIVPGNSPEAFIDDIRSMIAAVAPIGPRRTRRQRPFLHASGHVPGPGRHDPLRDYAAALEQLALSDNEISFVDLYDKTPTTHAVSLGYFLPNDGLHLPGRALWRIASSPSMRWCLSPVLPRYCC